MPGFFVQWDKKKVAVSGGSTVFVLTSWKFSALRVSGSDFLGLELLITLKSRSRILKPFTILYP